MGISPRTKETLEIWKHKWGYLTISLINGGDGIPERKFHATFNVDLLYIKRINLCHPPGMLKPTLHAVFPPDLETSLRTPASGWESALLSPCRPCLHLSSWSQKESPSSLEGNFVYTIIRCFLEQNFFLTKIKPQPVAINGKAQKKMKWQQSCRLKFRHQRVKLQIQEN